MARKKYDKICLFCRHERAVFALLHNPWKMCQRRILNADGVWTGTTYIRKMWNSKEEIQFPTRPIACRSCVETMAYYKVLADSYEEVKELIMRFGRDYMNVPTMAHVPTIAIPNAKAMILEAAECMGNL